jgi:hypothetical protein
MALGDNMNRKPLIPTNDEEMKQHAFNTQNEQNNPSSKEALQETSALPQSRNTFIEKNENVTLVFKPSLRKSINKINVTISGKLTIYSVRFIKACLTEHCRVYSTIDILLKDISDIDTSFIQLCYYYKQFKAQQGGEVTIDVENPNPDLIHLLVQANYNQLLLKTKLT